MADNAAKGIRCIKPGIKTIKVGVRQFIVLVFTILTTLATSIIIGLIAGIVIELLIQLISGAKIKYLFNSHVVVTSKEKSRHTLVVNGVLTFSNYLGLKKKLDQFTTNDHLQLDLSQAEYVDHTVMEHLYHLCEDYHRDGGDLDVIGTEKLKPLSTHPLSDRSLAV
jgi:MFS superfamily sulfate permease-like transporter